MSATTSITLFGIPNCDTVKKARTWLEQQSIPFAFHNFKKDGLTAEQIEIWLQRIELDTLINRKGTTWRALSEIQKSEANNRANAIALMLENPSVIKRPVLQINDDKLTHVGVGFNEQQYQTIFKEI
ncbi:ArsC family reductase [Undibacterium flavidum]|uniref:ArsC family reductase n=1 Tax=Undibacterium flavidum TaxID=2762297 RepID=A0ABR6YCR0_9BURK|nr:ArsC family reductase [Undibacterium flavidum]MBC3874307.1 ArsC family reductase [Undibacterium flavidum]